MENLNLKINKERVIEVIKEYAEEIFGTNMFLPLSVETEIKNKERLWKVVGKILVDIPQIKNIDDVFEFIKNSERFKKKFELKVEFGKIFDIMSFCFYINSYGKICAFYPMTPEISSEEKFSEIFHQLYPDWSEIKEKDLKDCCVIAKNFFSKGLDPKYFDFIPFVGWVIAHNSALILALVVSYLTLRTFSTFYIIKIVDNEVDIEMKKIVEK